MLYRKSLRLSPAEWATRPQEIPGFSIALTAPRRLRSWSIAASVVKVDHVILSANSHTSIAELNHRVREMQLEGPRSPLNCQVLSLHLPNSSQLPRASSHTLSSPVSAFARAQGSRLQSNSGSTHGCSASSTQFSTRSDRTSPPRHHSRNLTQASYHAPGPVSRSSRAPLYVSNGTTSPKLRSSDGYSSAQEAPVNMLLPLGSPGTARRAKAHVPSACVNCKRKHLACETRRPCNRCLQAGKEVRKHELNCFERLLTRKGYLCGCSAQEAW